MVEKSGQNINWIKHWLMEQAFPGALIAQRQARKIAPQPLNNLKPNNR